MSILLSPSIEQGPFKFEKTKEDYDLLHLELVFGKDMTGDQWIAKEIQEIIGKAIESSNMAPFPEMEEDFFRTFHTGLMNWAHTSECPLTELKWSSSRIISENTRPARSLSIVYKSVFNLWEYRMIQAQVL